MFFLLLAVILSGLHENPERKDWVTEKSTLKNLCKGHHLFGCMPSFLCHFLLLFWSNPSLSSTPILRRKNSFSPENGVGGGRGAAGVSMLVQRFAKLVVQEIKKTIWLSNLKRAMQVFTYDSNSSFLNHRVLTVFEMLFNIRMLNFLRKPWVCPGR